MTEARHPHHNLRGSAGGDTRLACPQSASQHERARKSFRLPLREGRKLLRAQRSIYSNILKNVGMSAGALLPIMYPFSRCFFGGGFAKTESAAPLKSAATEHRPPFDFEARCRAMVAWRTRSRVDAPTLLPEP
jgi:hypothetical protein